MKELIDLCEQAIRGVNKRFTIVWASRSVGVTWNESVWQVWASRSVGFTWDGSGCLRMSEDNPLWAAHDVAHVMVAAPERHHLPEWGLGPDPTGRYYDGTGYLGEAPRVVTDAAAEEEEEQACALHWCLAAYALGWEKALGVNEYLNSPLPTTTFVINTSRFKLPAHFTSVVLSELSLARARGRQRY